MFKEMKEKAILEQLSDIDIEILEQIYNEFDPKDLFYDDLEDLLNTYFQHPYDAARAAYFGDFSFNDVYFRLDAYENIKGLTDYEVKEEMIDFIKDNKNCIDQLDDTYLRYFNLDDIEILEEEEEEISAKIDDYNNLMYKNILCNNFNATPEQLEQLNNTINLIHTDEDLLTSAIYFEFNNHEYIVQITNGCPEEGEQEVINFLNINLKNENERKIFEKVKKYFWNLYNCEYFSIY